MTKIDRTNWPSGPWDDEPDELQFAWAGFHCEILRSDVTGTLCGYVAVPQKHAMYRLSADFVPVDAHGGITFSGSNSEKRGLWYLGFDCAHAFDRMPAMEATLKQTAWQEFGIEVKPYTYRDINYVRAQCMLIAHQLAQRIFWKRVTKRQLRRQVRLAYRDAKREKDRHDRDRSYERLAPHPRARGSQQTL